MRYLLLIITIISFCCLSCNHSKDKSEATYVEDFYTRNHGFDYIRIPLVKPFELTKLKGENSWCINSFLWKYKGGDIGNVDSIQCNDSIVVGHAQEYIDIENEHFNTPELWFIIDLNAKNISSYSNATEVRNLIGDISLINVDSVHSQYISRGILPWFPDSISSIIAKEY